MKITNEEYAELVRRSERLAFIERMIKDDGYLTKSELMQILNLSKKEEAE